MLGQPQAAARSTPCLVISERIHSLRARATASFSAASSSGSRFSSRSRARASWRSRASTWASSASWRMRAAPAALSEISCSTENLVPDSSLWRGKYPSSSSSSQTSPERFPATKQVLV